MKLYQTQSYSMAHGTMNMNVRVNVILRRFRVNTVAVEKQ